MARSKTIEALTRNLIYLVTGFEEEDENFSLSLEYVTSNFRYHKFLDVDAHKVKRIIEGIHDKFRIHCQDEKAVALTLLSERFLASPAFEGKESGHTDTHFSVLLCLLRLADSPTNAHYKETDAATQTVPVEEFNWGAYLLEGEERFLQFDDESPPVSEDDETVEEAVHVTSAVSEKPTSDAVRKATTTENTNMTQQFLERWGYSEIGQSRPLGSKLWLHENLMTRYWLGDVSKMESSNRSSNLIFDWESYQSRVNLLYASPNKFMLTEYQIVREILWMLTGAKDLFVFEWNGSKFRPNDRIIVGHLTDNALTTFLEHLAHYGNIVHKFGHFIDTVSQSHSSSSLPDATVSRTYQAFGIALFEFLQNLNSRLIAIEKTVCAQDETVTMAAVRDDLSPVFKDLDLLDLVFANGIESCGHMTSISQKALTLLSVLYQTLIDLDRQNLQDTRQMSLLFSLWIKTCRPYIEIIDSWVFEGLLLDTSNEFIVGRNKTVRSSDENFWDQAFSFTCELASSSSCQNLPQSSSEVPVDPLPQRKTATATDAAAGFLMPVLREIVLTGKSMELLKSLGRIKDVVSATEYKNSLYSKYLESLKAQLLSQESQPEIISSDTQELNSSTPLMSPGDALRYPFDRRAEMQLNGVSPNDPLLRINFQQMFDSRKQTNFKENTEPDDIISWFSAVDVPILVPLQWTLQKCLYSHLTSQYHLVSSKLLSILKKEYRLLDYFAAIRYEGEVSYSSQVDKKPGLLLVKARQSEVSTNIAYDKHFFLMDAGGTMYEFYTAIFEKIRLHEPWQDVSFVNTILQEALQSHHQDDRERLFLSVDGEQTKEISSPKATDALDNIVLHYKISWPVDIVITSRHMKIYNMVFLFLLQIKRAKYVLDRLRFSDLEIHRSEEPNTDAELKSDPRRTSDFVHRLHVFRMRLLHFVNSLHNYIMTRILHSVGIEFQTEMEAAGDLDEVISIHNTYVHRIHERCLLHRKVAFIREMIVRVLAFARTVEGLWNHDNGLIRWQILMEVESEFMRCIQFLSSMIHKVTARGTFPHLESLAFALITCSESIRQERR